MFPTKQKKGSEMVACGKRLFQKRLKNEFVDTSPFKIALVPHGDSRFTVYN